MTLRSSPLLRLRSALQRLFGVSGWQSMLLWSIVAGLLGTLATEGFRAALRGFEHVVLGPGDSLVAMARALPWWARIAFPAVGGLVAGGLLVLAKRVAVRSATSDYMEAIVLGDGRIPVAQTLVRSASSLVSIGTGGSIGREGSMVQLAALAASLLGRVFRFPVERLRLLVACGAAAGLTAAYNAPIAGAFFVAEIVLGSMAMESLGPILIAAVVANIVMRALPGYQHVNLATDCGGCGDRVQRGCSQHLIGVFSDNQDSHQITFASFFSFSTSSATDLTLMPALRAAGASTLTVLLVEAVETPKASGVTDSSGFFLAFMMFGRDA